MEDQQIADPAANGDSKFGKVGLAAFICVVQVKQCRRHPTLFDLWISVGIMVRPILLARRIAQDVQRLAPCDLRIAGGGDGAIDRLDDQILGHRRDHHIVAVTVRVAHAFAGGGIDHRRLEPRLGEQLQVAAFGGAEEADDQFDMRIGRDQFALGGGQFRFALDMVEKRPLHRDEAVVCRQRLQHRQRLGRVGFAANASGGEIGRGAKRVGLALRRRLADPAIGLIEVDRPGHPAKAKFARLVLRIGVARLGQRQHARCSGKVALIETQGERFIGARRHMRTLPQVAK